MHSDMYRRNDFKSWFADVGFLYVVVAAFVALIFALGSLHRAALSPERADAARVRPDESRCGPPPRQQELGGRHENAHEED